MTLQVDIDDYDLGEQIGAGTVGTIFKAVEKQSGEIRAIKFLVEPFGKNDLVVSRFWREMMILEELDHPNVLSYYGGGQRGSQLFFVMEYVAGGTLKDLLRESGPLSWPEVAEVGRQVSAALQYAHNFGIIHRDLKPGNVFVEDSGILKLGDFGIARDMRAADLTDTGLTVGTYAYMAPELVRGERAITGQVDLYALGCLLFELLTGHTPYVGDNFAQIFEQHLHSDPPRVRRFGVKCPEIMEDLIVQLIAKKPDDRPFNARAVQGVLGELLEGASSSPEAGDRGAAEISAARERIAERVHERAPVSRELTWAQMGWILAGILGFIVVALLMGQGNQ